MQTPDITASQLIQYVFFLAISTCVGWIVKVLPGIRDDVRAVKREVMGLNGSGGLIKDVAEHNSRLDVIEDRHIKEDAVTEIERELSTGKMRRLRDRLQGIDEAARDT